MDESPGTQPVSQGTCALCGQTVTEAAMAEHLQGCRLPLSTSRGAAPGFHLLVQGRYDPEFWLHLGAPAAATLHDLDAFLRDI